MDIFAAFFFSPEGSLPLAVAFIGIAINGTTSAMRQHLEHIHHAVWLKMKNPTGAGTLERFVQKGSEIEKDVLDRLIAEFVATDERPVSLVEGSSRSSLFFSFHLTFL